MDGVVHHLLHPSPREIAVGLAFLPGLVCVLGLGHLYLGRYRRAAAFLGLSVAFGIGFLAALTPLASNPAVAVIISPILFPVGGLLACLIGTYDVYRLTQESPGGAGRAAHRATSG